MNNVGVAIVIGSGLIMIGSAVKLAVEWSNTSVAHKLINIGELVMVASISILAAKAY